MQPRRRSDKTQQRRSPKNWSRRVTGVLLLSGAAFFTGACGRNSGDGAVIKDVVDPIGDDDSLEVAFYAPATRLLPTGIQTTLSFFCYPAECSDLNHLVSTLTIPTGDVHRRRMIAERGNRFGAFFAAERIPYLSLPRWELADRELRDNHALLEVRLDRIEVNHMRVTRADGSTYTVVGQVHIERVTSEDTRGGGHGQIVGYMTTGHGVDLPKGSRYKVTVTAATEDGQDGYETYVNL